MKLRTVFLALLSASVLPLMAEEEVKLLTKTVNLSWSQNVTVDSGSFASAREGSTIEIQYRNIKADYHKFKVYAVADSWMPLGFGGVGGANFMNGDLETVQSSGTVVVTLTADDVAGLKRGGLVMHGYGLKVSKMRLLPSGGGPQADGGSAAGRGAAEAESFPADESGPRPKIAPPKPHILPPPIDTAKYGGSGSASAGTADNPAPGSAGGSGTAAGGSGTGPLAAPAGSPVASHGRLHVDGAYLYDSRGVRYQLYGMSTHGLSWFGQYVNREGFKTLRDDWNTNCVRLALYPAEYNGYCTGGNQEELKRLVYSGIDFASELGMYVIVDWHILSMNPTQYKEQAKAFFAELSHRYASYPNVLYEICNEPTGSDWNSVLKPYAEELIPVIRQNAPEAIVIVGTNTWSQEIDKAAANPIRDYKNVMYTLHFYANTHTQWMRDRLEKAVAAGLPVFVTEFGSCDASGNGGFNPGESQKWFDLLDKYGISHCNWSLCNKAETASVISSSCGKLSGWTEAELTESGRLIRQHFRSLTR